MSIGTNNCSEIASPLEISTNCNFILNDFVKKPSCKYCRSKIYTLKNVSSICIQLDKNVVDLKFSILIFMLIYFYNLMKRD